MPSLSKTIWNRILCVALLSANAYGQVPVMIKGTPVEKGTWLQVVQISSAITSTASAKCTATIIGPSAVITSATCVKRDGTKVKFTIGEKVYAGTPKVSPLFPKKDHNIAVIVTDEPIQGVTPARVGGKYQIGLGLQLLGYGCTEPQGGGANDGILRIAETVTIGESNFDMVSKKANGGAICHGDNGGPAFVTQDGKTLLLGVASKGNILDSNWHTRLDMKESVDFLTDMGKQTTICGINSDCNDTNPPPPPQGDKPSCTLTASPNTVKTGDVVLLSMISQNAVSAKIGDQTVTVPNGQSKVTATDIGTFTAQAEVTSKDGSSATCNATYKVEKNDQPPPPQDRPTCTLTATPAEVKPGGTVTLELVATGNVNYASIENKLVSFPVGKLVITAQTKGEFAATGFIRGPGGPNNCYADYKVTDDGGSTPTIPPYTVVPAYCGENTMLESKVYTVCVGVVRKDDSIPDLRLGQVLLVTYSDSTKEVLPILARKTRTRAEGETQVTEDLVLYANGQNPGPGFVVLDTRQATLTKLPASSPGGGEVPVGLEGRTATGKYFIVEQLSAQSTPANPAQ